MKLSQESEDTKLLLRARRMATRVRAATACKQCKSKKSKCSDYRPCALCKVSRPWLCDAVETFGSGTSGKESGGGYKSILLILAIVIDLDLKYLAVSTKL